MPVGSWPVPTPEDITKKSARFGDQFGAGWAKFKDDENAERIRVVLTRVDRSVAENVSDSGARRLVASSDVENC